MRASVWIGPELLAGAERPVDHGAVGRAPQLRPHERAALAGLDVLELDDLEDVPSTSMWFPFLNWLVEITESKASRAPRVYPLAPVATVEDDLALAERAARAAAAVALARCGDAVRAEAKDAPTDVVSEVDRAAEAAAVEIICTARPHDGIVGEEGARREGERTWVIDALDGTLNYLLGLRGWCAAVALETENGALVSAVCDPVAEELFSAAAGRGARLNGRPLVASPGRHRSTRPRSPPSCTSPSASSRASSPRSRACWRAPAASGSPAPARWSSPTSPPAACTAGSSPPPTAGTGSPARCWSRRPAGSRPASRPTPSGASPRPTRASPARCRPSQRSEARRERRAPLGASCLSSIAYWSAYQGEKSIGAYVTSKSWVVGHVRDQSYGRHGLNGFTRP